MNTRHIFGDPIGAQHAFDAAGLTQEERERALNRVGIGSRIASGLAVPAGVVGGMHLGGAIGRALGERGWFPPSKGLGAFTGPLAAKYLVDRIRGTMIANQIRKERAKLAWRIPLHTVTMTPAAVAGSAAAAAGRRAVLREANLTDEQYAEAVRRIGAGDVAANAALGVVGGYASAPLATLLPGGYAQFAGFLAGAAAPNYLLGKAQGRSLVRQVRGKE